MSHLTYEERMLIQTMLDDKCSLKSIARKLNRPTSTISREIKKHISITPKAKANLCKHYYGCTYQHVCSTTCHAKCRNCSNCIRYCPNYEEDICETILESPYVCNGCTEFRCKREKHHYKATKAQREYTNVLSDCRSGFNVTDEQLQLIDEAVSPLILKGLSPYHVSQTVKNTIPVSESTIYRMVSSTKLNARNIDLINKVKRKQRKYPVKRITKEVECKIKDGHRYQDYLDFQAIHDYPVVEIDCVEGIKEDHAVLMTLHFVSSHMQLAFILNEHTSEAVVGCLDMLEQVLGTELYMDMFPLLLTDNGHEFLNREKMERSCLIPGRIRSLVYYCEPNRSDEKGHCEKNHTHIRYVIPKGTSMEPFSQFDISLMMNHINSYYRKSLHGKTPYEVAEQIFPEDFFILLGLEKIPPQEVLLKPSLLKHSNKMQPLI